MFASWSIECSIYLCWRTHTWLMAKQIIHPSIHPFDKQSKIFEWNAKFSRENQTDQYQKQIPLRAKSIQRIKRRKRKTFFRFSICCISCHRKTSFFFAALDNTVQSWFFFVCLCLCVNLFECIAISLGQ